eukprot:scaffold10716_cov63-Phaeocystis_antarctica.AAC.3
MCVSVSTGECCVHTDVHALQFSFTGKRTDFAHDTALRAVRSARARWLASSSQDPQLHAAASCSAGLLSSPLQRSASGARGRDSLAPRAEPRADLSGALAQQRVACAVEGAVILLCRGRDDVGHAGRPRRQAEPFLKRVRRVRLGNHRRIVAA